MNIFERNNQAKKKGKALFVEPDGSDLYPSINYPVIIENINSKTGLKTARVRTNEQEQGIYIHSPYDPVIESKRKVDALDLSKHTLIVVFGIGLGYQLFELQKRISNKSRVIVIENSIDVFNNTMKQIDFTGVYADKRFSFLVDLNPEQILHYFRSILGGIFHFSLASNVQFLNLNYYDRLFPGIAQDISSYILKDVFNTWATLGNSPGDVILGLMQSFKNIDEALENPTIKDLREKYKDKPAVIVAAGPSLDKNVELLKEVEGKALILACDVTLRGLTKREIRPDAVFTLERNGLYEQVFKDRDFEIPEEVVFSAPILIEPEMFKMFRNNKKVIGFRSGETVSMWMNRVLGDKGVMFMGSSVAHLAMGFALEVGANPVILIGQDLAFSETGKTHGGDIDSKVQDATQKLVDATKGVVYIKDYNGNPIKSTRIWKSFLVIFENKIMATKGKKFIDATEGGAYIRGTEIMTLREVIDTYVKHQNIPRLNDIVPEVERTEDKKEAYKKLIEALIEKRKYFQGTRKLAGGCLRGLNKIKQKYEETYQSISPNQNREICEQLNKADAVFNRMKGEELSVIIYQGLFSSTIYQVNNIGFETTNENVWKNLLLQEDFLLAARQTAIGVTKAMRMIQRYLKVKIEKYPKNVNPDEFLIFDFRI